MKSSKMRVRLLAILIPGVVIGCGTEPTTPSPVAYTPASTFAALAEPSGGAIVLNSGEGKDEASCFFGAFTTTQGTAVRSPSGNATLSCQFDGLAPIASKETIKGWLCTINVGGSSQTRQSQWVRLPSGSAHMTCQSSGKPLNDAAVSFAGSGYSAQQGNFSAPLSDVPGQRVQGQAVDAGLACTAVLPGLAGKIAVIERGTCLFSVKLANALANGAVAAIVYNNGVPPASESVIIMAGTAVDLPGVFVARSTGLALLAAAPTNVAITYCNRSASCRGEF